MNAILIEILKKETVSLKEQYISMTKDWSVKRYDLYIEQSKYNEEKWCEILVVTPEVKNAGTSNEYKGFPRGFYNTKASKEYHNHKQKIKSVLNLTIQQYTDKCVKDAEEHYEDSIQKLAFRIEKKGLKVDAIEVKTSHIGVNINTILTDGIQTIKAFTIIAQGAIQKPHYRYLIK